MDDIDDSYAWHQQELCERQRLEEEQRLLRADPAFREWLEQIDSQRKGANYGDHGK